MKNQQTPEHIAKHMKLLHKLGLAQLSDPSDGTILNIIEARTASGEVMMIPLTYGSQLEKQIMFGELKKMFKAQNVIGFYTLTEAWNADIHQDDAAGQAKIKAHLAAGKSLESFEGREEVMMVGYTSHEENIVHSYAINRDAEDKFTHLGEVRVYSSKAGDPEAAGGAMTDLLPKPEDFTFTQIH